MDFDFDFDFGEMNTFALAMGLVGALVTFGIMMYVRKNSPIDMIWVILSVPIGFIAGYLYISATDR